VQQELTTKLKTVRDILTAVSIGDRLGMPVETMSRAEIIEALGPEGVTKYLYPVQAQIHKTSRFVAGKHTDDWQLTACNIKSFLTSRDYDPKQFALDHVDAMQNSVAGWGKTTMAGLVQIQEYFRSKGKVGRHYLVPAVCGPNQGAGNGVAMQISPLAIFANLKKQDGFFHPEPLCSWVLSLGRMTHSDVDAINCAYVLASAYSYLLDHPLQNNRSIDCGLFIEFLCNQANFFQGKFGVQGQLPQLLRRIQCAVANYSVFSDPNWARETFGTGVLAVQSVPYSIAKFLQYQQDFEKGVLAAINDGGDTDSTGSMVAGLIAANQAEIPVWMKEFPNQTEQDNPAKIIELADLLFVTANG